MDERPYRYPWARALMVFVLYGALLVFLWHFPTSGGRAFFQAVFKGFLYIFAGLALIAVTVVFLFFFPIPPLPAKMQDKLVEREYADDDEAAYDDDGGGIFTGRAVLVPTFKDPQVESRVWDILEAIQSDLDFYRTVVADVDTGVIAVTDDDDDEARAVLRELRSRLKKAGIAVRAPR